MDRRVALAFARFDAAELKFCRYLNHSSRSSAVRQLFRAVSWLGDGWLWYGLMLALPLIDGLAGLQASLHMVATGAVGLALYKSIKNRAVRERPYITHSAIECASAPLDRYSFPSGHTLHAVSLHVAPIELLPRVDGRINRPCAAHRSLTRDPRPPLPDRRRRRRRAWRVAGLRQLADRHVLADLTLRRSCLRVRMRWHAAPPGGGLLPCASPQTPWQPSAARLCREARSWVKQAPVGIRALDAPS